MDENSKRTIVANEKEKTHVILTWPIQILDLRTQPRIGMHDKSYRGLPRAKGIH